MMSDKPTVRVIGTIASLRVMDVSKRAGVKNLKSYVELEIETIEPAALRDRLARRIQLIKDGELEIAAGSRVEVETDTDAAGIGPLPIYRISRV